MSNELDQHEKFAEDNAFLAQIITENNPINEKYLKKLYEIYAAEEKKERNLRARLKKLTNKIDDSSQRILQWFTTYLKAAKYQEEIGERYPFKKEETVEAHLLSRGITIQQLVDEFHAQIRIQQLEALNLVDKRSVEDRVAFFMNVDRNPAISSIKAGVRAAYPSQKTRLEPPGPARDALRKLSQSSEISQEQKSSRISNELAQPKNEQLLSSQKNWDFRHSRTTLNSPLYRKSQGFNFRSSSPTLSQVQITESLVKFVHPEETIKMVETYFENERRLQNNHIYNPAEGQYASASPSQKLVERNKSLINQTIKDQEILIADDESSDSDVDSEIAERKNMEKLQKRNKCLDAVTESAAIEDIIKGIEKAKRRVNVKSVIKGGSFNFEQVKGRQDRIRQIIDGDKAPDLFVSSSNLNQSAKNEEQDLLFQEQGLKNGSQFQKPYWSRLGNQYKNYQREKNKNLKSDIKKDIKIHNKKQLQHDFKQYSDSPKLNFMFRKAEDLDITNLQESLELNVDLKSLQVELENRFSGSKSALPKMQLKENQSMSLVSNLTHSKPTANQVAESESKQTQKLVSHTHSALLSPTESIENYNKRYDGNESFKDQISDSQTSFLEMNMINQYAKFAIEQVDQLDQDINSTISLNRSRIGTKQSIKLSSKMQREQESSGGSFSEPELLLINHNLSLQPLIKESFPLKDEICNDVIPKKTKQTVNQVFGDSLNIQQLIMRTVPNSALMSEKIKEADSYLSPKSNNVKYSSPIRVQHFNSENKTKGINNQKTSANVTTTATDTAAHSNEQKIQIKTDIQQNKAKEKNETFTKYFASRTTVFNAFIPPKTKSQNKNVKGASGLSISNYLSEERTYRNLMNTASADENESFDSRNTNSRELFIKTNVQLNQFQQSQTLTPQQFARQNLKVALVQVGGKDVVLSSNLVTKQQLLPAIHEKIHKQEFEPQTIKNLSELVATHYPLKYKQKQQKKLKKRISYQENTSRVVSDQQNYQQHVKSWSKHQIDNLDFNQLISAPISPTNQQHSPKLPILKKKAINTKFRESNQVKTEMSRKLGEQNSRNSSVMLNRTSNNFHQQSLKDQLLQNIVCKNVKPLVHLNHTNIIQHQQRKSFQLKKEIPPEQSQADQVSSNYNLFLQAESIKFNAVI